MGDTQRVKVVARVRPCSTQQDAENTPLRLERESGEVHVRSGGQAVRAVVDRALGAEATQEELFEAVGRDAVRAALKGLDATVLAYGQTGTGKTHTMLGARMEELLADGSAAPRGSWGVIPRAAELLFASIEHNQDDTEPQATVHMSCLQIYNEKLFDLLQDRRRQFPLQLRENKHKQVYVQGLSEYRVGSFDDVMTLLQRGMQSIATRRTEHNVASSRAHVVLQLSVELEVRVKGGRRALRRSTLSLVDLAGSEKCSPQGEALGRRHMRELTNINTSLHTLGNCIAALAERRRAHVPYRDSALTRLLQDSLGGSAITTVVVTLSPDVVGAEETVHTLGFADRAKNVLVRAKVNEVASTSQRLASALKEVAFLRQLVAQLSEQGVGARVAELEAENARLRAQVGGGGVAVPSTAPTRLGALPEGAAAAAAAPALDALLEAAVATPPARAETDVAPRRRRQRRLEKRRQKRAELRERERQWQSGPSLAGHSASASARKAPARPYTDAVRGLAPLVSVPGPEPPVPPASAVSAVSALSATSSLVSDPGEVWALVSGAAALTPSGEVVHSAGGRTPGAGGRTPGAGGRTPGAGGRTPGVVRTPGAPAAVVQAENPATEESEGEEEGDEEEVDDEPELPGVAKRRHSRRGSKKSAAGDRRRERSQRGSAGSWIAHLGASVSSMEARKLAKELERGRAEAREA